MNREDPRVDHRILNITDSDSILAISSAGDNILDYLLSRPRRVHAVDLNPNQNHLLELKVACFAAGLPHSTVWSLFGEGKHAEFQNLLITKLSPHLSSVAFGYWLNHASVFEKSGLYETGGSRHAIRLVRILFQIFGLTPEIERLCAAETLNEQREIWPRIRKVLLSRTLHWAIVSTEAFCWKAAGVPREQREMIIQDWRRLMGLKENAKGGKDEAVWQYVVDTLDPVIENTLVRSDNYFYYLCLNAKFSKK